MSATQAFLAFDQYLSLWRLTPDGDPLTTRSSRLLPVRHDGRRAMLKVAVEDEEKAGGALMAWWNGLGAAHVLAHDTEAVLLEWADGSRSLAAMARNGQDDQATSIICNVVAALHAPRPRPPPVLVPLDTWFGELEASATSHGGLLGTAWTTARHLLADPREPRVLHGDIHHDNILNFEAGGWRAIDSKGLSGERGYDYANLFRNPGADVALRPGRFDMNVALVSDRAAIEPKRLLQWILAVMGLSAAWHIADADLPKTTLTIAEKAAAALAQIT